MRFNSVAISSQPRAVAQEKSLFWCKAVNSHTRLAFHRFLKSGVGYDHPPRSAIDSPANQLAVLIETLFDLKLLN